MPTVTKAANASPVIDSPGFTNPGNAFATAGDNVYATLPALKNSNSGAGNLGSMSLPGVSAAEIPDGSAISAVRLVLEWGISASVTGIGVGAAVNKVWAGVIDAQTTKTTTTEAALTLQPSTLPTLADIRSDDWVRVRFRAWKGNTNTASNLNVDFVRVELDYTTPPPAKSGTGSAGQSSSPTASGQKKSSGTASAAASSTLIVGARRGAAGSGTAGLTSATAGIGVKAARGIGALSQGALVDGAGDQLQVASGIASLSQSVAIPAVGSRATSGSGASSVLHEVTALGRKQAAGVGVMSAVLAVGASAMKRAAGMLSLALAPDLVAGGAKRGSTKASFAQPSALVASGGASEPTASQGVGAIAQLQATAAAGTRATTGAATAGAPITAGGIGRKQSPALARLDHDVDLVALGLTSRFGTAVVDLAQAMICSGRRPMSGGGRGTAATSTRELRPRTSTRVRYTVRTQAVAR